MFGFYDQIMYSWLRFRFTLYAGEIPAILDYVQSAVDPMYGGIKRRTTL